MWKACTTRLGTDHSFYSLDEITRVIRKSFVTDKLIEGLSHRPDNMGWLNLNFTDLNLIFTDSE